TVVEWLKQVGDTIEEYEPIVRVSTDKVDTEIPAPADGILMAIHIPEGETVDSNVILGTIGAPGEKYNAQSVSVTTTSQNGTHLSEEQPVPVVAQPVKQATGAIYTGHISPVVARMVTEHQLDLNLITGTGRDGRITKKDVLKYLEQQPAQTDDTSDLDPWEKPGSGDLFASTVDYELEPETPSQAPIKSRPLKKKKSRPVKSTPLQMPPAQKAVPGQLRKLSGMRKSIAAHMVHSKLQTSPHVTTVFEVDLSAVVKHRNAHKADFAAQGVKLTFTPYFVMATAQALQAVPIINSSWTDDGIQLHHPAHIGMAVALDEGLIVPVIKNTQDYNLMGLARQVNDLTTRARQQHLTPDDVQGSTFTITNHGVSGSLFATPIINQPNAAILGVGKIEKRVKVIDDAIAIRPCGYLSLTFDHRMIDGADGDGFMQHLTNTLSNWS
ncbi:MAG: dihydrolipoamide acetyltransferase family protein, partial [Aggregatilineales bacterium]